MLIRSFKLQQIDLNNFLRQKLIQKQQLTLEFSQKEMIPLQQYFQTIDRFHQQIPSFHINSSFMPQSTSFFISQQQGNSTKCQNILISQRTFSSAPYLLAQANSSQLQNPPIIQTVSSPLLSQVQRTQDTIINTQTKLLSPEQLRTFNKPNSVQQKNIIPPIVQRESQNEQPLELFKKVTYQQEKNNQQPKRNQCYSFNNTRYQLKDQTYQLNSTNNSVPQEVTRETRSTSTLSSNLSMESNQRELFTQTAESYFTMKRPSKLSNPSFQTDQDILEIARKYTSKEKQIIYGNTNGNGNNSPVNKYQIKSPSSNVILPDKSKLDCPKLPSSNYFSSNNKEEKTKMNSLSLSRFSPFNCSSLKGKKQLGESYYLEGQQSCLLDGEKQQTCQQLLKKEQLFPLFSEEHQQSHKRTDFKFPMNSVDILANSSQQKEAEILLRHPTPKQTSSELNYQFKTHQNSTNITNIIQKDNTILKNDHYPSAQTQNLASNGIQNCFNNLSDQNKYQHMDQNKQNNHNSPSKKSSKFQKKKMSIDKTEVSPLFEECSNTLPSKEELPSDVVFSLVDMIQEKDFCNSKSLDVIEEELSELEISRVSQKNNLEINTTNSLISIEDLTDCHKNAEKDPIDRAQIHIISELDNTNKYSFLARKTQSFIILVLLLLLLLNLGNSTIWHSYCQFPSHFEVS